MDTHKEEKAVMSLKVNDIVRHVEYPDQCGTVVAVTKRWPSGPPVILVKWGKSNHCSRHIPSALRLV